MSCKVGSENDGSRRLLKVCIIAVSMELSEADTLRLVNEVHRTAPFPKEWNDRDILKRLRDAEKKQERGAGSTRERPNSDRPTSGRDAKHLTDQGNAQRLVERHGTDLRYCHRWNTWLVWDNTRWAEDESGEIDRRAKDVARQLWIDAAAEEDPDKRKTLLQFATQSEKAERLGAMIRLARSELGVPVTPSELDQHDWLLNCPNGTLNLKTGELYPHRRDDRLTKLCPTRFNPDAPSYHWDRFIEGIFDREQALIDFARRLCGYCLTGSTAEQIIVIAHGAGSNGKSTWLEALLATLGPHYAMQAVSDLLMVKQNEQHPTERADLRGMRLVSCIETEASKSLNESLVKQLTGSDRIRARKLYQDHFEFKPTHKIILATNHKPTVKGSDHAIWRRLILLPFGVRYWDPDKGETGEPHLRVDKALPAKLAAEAEGILAWCVRGCQEWRRDGLQVPVEVLAVTKEYRADQDRIGQFVAECCVTGGMVRVRANALYGEYRHWSERRGEYSVSMTRFGEAMKERNM